MQGKVRLVTEISTQHAVSVLMAALLNLEFGHLQNKNRNTVDKSSTSPWTLNCYKVTIPAFVNQRIIRLHAQNPHNAMLQQNMYLRFRLSV